VLISLSIIYITLILGSFEKRDYRKAYIDTVNWPRVSTNRQNSFIFFFSFPRAWIRTSSRFGPQLIYVNIRYSIILLRPFLLITKTHAVTARHQVTILLIGCLYINECAYTKGPLYNQENSYAEHALRF